MMTKDTTIEIGHHVTFKVGPLVFNRDTITSTLIAGVIVVLLGLLLRRQVSTEVPGKIQVFWEMLISWVNEQVESNLGKLNPFVVPLAVALFIFILVANWLETVPTGEKVPPPTADTNLTYAMAIIVIVGVHILGVSRRGGKEYAKGFLEPYPVMAPLNIIEELIKPFTLALRLFGNIFASGIMIALLGLLPAYALWAPTVVWKLFAMAIGVIQAFIFALLTILYFGMAAEGHGGGGGGHEESHDASTEDEDEDEREQEPEGELQPA
jgi:F-type H+-transporting ATPase subunit a